MQVIKLRTNLGKFRTYIYGSLRTNHFAEIPMDVI